MRPTLAVFALAAAISTPHAGAQNSEAAKQKAAAEARAAALKNLDGQLQRGEWAAAEAEARSLLSDALLRHKDMGTFDAVARLALAEAGQGRTEEALWDWTIAQNLKVDFDPKPFGAPGALLAGHPLRQLDGVPAGLALRREGDGGVPFSPPHMAEVKKVDLPTVWEAVPKGIRVQVIVDPQGRAEQPVVALSTSPALSYALLTSLRDWRFTPAKSGEAPVAAFYEIRVPVQRRPLVEVADFTASPLAPAEAALRAGRYPEAAKQVGKVWRSGQDRDSIPSRGFLGVALALKALAQAGQGETDRAICRWQAAQTLEPHLYGADLSAYGAAGALLEAHPWGEPVVGNEEKKRWKNQPPAQVQRPEILERRQPEYPEYARVDRMQGTVVVQSIILATGGLRNLALVSPNTLPPGMEANALDALCDWRFKPATWHGEPVPVYYSLTVNFEIRK